MRIGGFFLIIGSYLVTLFGTNFKYIYEFFILIVYGMSVGLLLQNTVIITQQSAPKKCKIFIELSLIIYIFIYIYIYIFIY